MVYVTQKISKIETTSMSSTTSRKVKALLVDLGEIFIVQSYVCLYLLIHNCENTSPSRPSWHAICRITRPSTITQVGPALQSAAKVIYVIVTNAQDSDIFVQHGFV